MPGVEFTRKTPKGFCKFFFGGEGWGVVIVQGVGQCYGG